MDLDALLPIIDDIVKESLNDEVYMYGRKVKGKGRRVASGTLKNSVKSVIETNKEGIQIIKLTYLGGKSINQDGVYAYWLVNDRNPGPAIGSQKGRKRKGKTYQPGPFVSGIMKWIENKKDFKIKNLKTGETLPKNEKNIKSTAYVIARSIGMFGFKNEPQNFIEVSYDKILSNEKIKDIIQDATYEELLKAIEGI